MSVVCRVLIACLCIEIMLTGCSFDTDSGDLSTIGDEPTGESEQSLVAAPAYRNRFWEPMGGPPGGKGYDIRAHRDHPNLMYVTDALAGVFRSTNFGQSWESINDGLQREVSGRVPAFSLTIDPHDGDNIWAGMEVSGQLFLSTDGGDSWVRRDTGLLGPGSSIRGITIDPNAPSIVYCAMEVELGLLGYDEWEAPGGAVYRSENYGRNWVEIWSGDALARYVWVDPDNSDVIFISTGIFDRAAANSTQTELGGVGIVRSENHGLSWEILNENNGLPGRRVPSLFMHPDDSYTLVAAVIPPVSGRRPAGVYVTSDRGDSWYPSLAPGHSPASVIGENDEVHAVEIVENQTNIWYAAGRPTNSDQGIFWTSSNGGSTWTRHLILLPGWLNSTPIDIEVNPIDSDHVFINNYGGGNVVSLDGGANWTDASDGYTGAQSTAIAVEPGTRAEVIAAGSLGTFASSNGGAFEGVRIFAAEGFIAHTLRYVPSAQPGGATRLLAGNGYGNIYRLDDNARGWTATTQQIQDVAQVPLFSTMTDFAFSDDRPNEIFTGFYSRGCEEYIMPPAWQCDRVMPGLFVSNDTGDHWTEVADTPFSDVGIFDIEVSNHPRRVYVGTQDGLFTRDFTQRGGWIYNIALRVETSSNPRVLEEEALGPIVGAVGINPHNEQVILAGTSPGVLFRSTDSGLTWSASVAGLEPNEVVLDIVFDPNPRTSPVVYLATDRGVRYSTDGGISWQAHNSGLTFTGAHRLALSDDGGVLYVATMGGGVFRLGTP